MRLVLCKVDGLMNDEARHGDGRDELKRSRVAERACNHVSTRAVAVRLVRVVANRGKDVDKGESVGAVDKP